MLIWMFLGNIDLSPLKSYINNNLGHGFEICTSVFYLGYKKIIRSEWPSYSHMKYFGSCFPLNIQLLPTVLEYFKTKQHLQTIYKGKSNPAIQDTHNGYISSQKGKKVSTKTSFTRIWKAIWYQVQNLSSPWGRHIAKRTNKIQKGSVKTKH